VLAGLVLPAIAMGASGVDLNGQVIESGTANPVAQGQVALFEYTTMVGWDQVDWSWTNASGLYSVTGDNVGDGVYMARAGKPGYVTQDTPGTFTLPGPGAEIYNFSLAVDPDTTERLAENDRYSTAVDIARERFTTAQNPTLWLGVDTIVIASGEDRAAADPLAASGLCGVYDAPLFLVNSNGVPSSVKKAVTEIMATRAMPHVIIVGGPASVPEPIIAELDALSADGIVADRIIDTGDRYDLAAAIAMRIKDKRGALPWALIANGADSTKFFDALALSPISARENFPILLVTEDSIPSATRKALTDFGTPDIVIGGGPATVSNEVMADLDATHGTVERWSGSDRYWTATAIATNAIDKTWLANESVAIAAKLPDALTGGSTVGQAYGTLLLTQSDTLPSATGNWLSSNKGTLAKCYVLGGPASVTDGVKNQINSKLQ
jgi:putative cell wall-binding protein